MTSTPPTVAILGVGMMGGSLALALKESGRYGRLQGYAPRPETRDYLRSAEMLDAVYETPEAAVDGADIVVYAAPVEAYADLTRAVAPALKEGALVTDIGSVKQAAVEAVRPHLPAHVTYVPAHPIAGSEKSGPQAADAGIFEGALCVLTPTEETASAALAKTVALWEGIGMRTVILSTKEHDRIYAAVSHIPQWICFQAGNILKTGGLESPGREGLPVVRLLDSTLRMWEGIFSHNREAMLPLQDAFNIASNTLCTAVKRHDTGRLAALWEKAERLRCILVPGAVTAAGGRKKTQPSHNHPAYAVFALSAVGYLLALEEYIGDIERLAPFTGSGFRDMSAALNAAWPEPDTLPAFQEACRLRSICQP